MKTSKINSKQKGARREREFAEYLRSLGIEARRGVQYAGGPESPDVITDLEHIHFEVKGTERFNPDAAFAQAERDAEASNKIPIVALKKNRKPWMLFARADDLLPWIIKRS